MSGHVSIEVFPEQPPDGLPPEIAAAFEATTKAIRCASCLDCCRGEEVLACWKLLQSLISAARTTVDRVAVWLGSVSQAEKAAHAHELALDECMGRINACMYSCEFAEALGRPSEARSGLESIRKMPTPDWSRLRADLYREACRAAAAMLAAGIAQPDKTKAVAPLASQPLDDPDQLMQRLAQAVGDDTTVRVLAILNREDLSSQEKMRLLIKLDQRFKGKDSNEWAMLLKVTPQAVRGYDAWKELRQEKKSLD
jgi:hypothetical protein